VTLQLDALRATFGNAVGRDHVARDGMPTVVVQAASLLDVMTALRDTQAFNYLVDVTAVEYRDRERPLEVVYTLRGLTHRGEVRVKVELDPRGKLEVPSVVSLWRGADWLEREVYDMFGVQFLGHPDLRRILMWETYAEGHPLRKDFPLRGRFSRAEQVRQALKVNPEGHYSLEELSIADSYGDLPQEMRERLRRGERGKITDAPETR
jgi:NADH-quinone oxidoreductase subunit C